MALENIYEAEMRWDDTDPEGYRAAVADMTKTLGAEALSVRVFELPPGESLCPYHYEYEEEWLIVLEGSIVLRTPAGEQTIGRGAITSFPVGPAGAHKTTNRGPETARVLMFSSAREPAVAVYPDSDKVGVWSGNDADQLMVHRRDGSVGYYDGEL
jgi:uncharacterized cupin superfamily protein